MIKCEYDNQIYSIKELSEMSGISEATIRSRLRKGYPVEEAIRYFPLHESVKDFDDSSWWEDYLNKSTREVYEIYWGWCIKNKYKPLTHSGFTRQLFSMYPNLKCVPSRTSNGCCRIIRER